VGEVWQTIERFRDHSKDQHVSRRRARQEWRLRELLAQRFLRHVDNSLPPGDFQRIVDAVATRALDPYAAADDIVDRTLGREARQ
jgi:putative protein kinase ArgK-like GTPase of G3E family